MSAKTPAFWWQQSSAAGRWLSPLGRLYGYFAGRAMERTAPVRLPAPVLCLGNFTLGGTGKTPLAIAFARAAKKHGLKPGIVSRGFGGSLSRGLHRVDAARDRAREVGDEPLLLAAYAMVEIGADRAAAGQRLIAAGADFIIMDDGFQSRRLYPDYALLAADSLRGLGNHRVFPAGPLRAPLILQLGYADALIMTGGRAAGAEAAQAEKVEMELARLAARGAKPFYTAELGSFVSRPYQGRQNAAGASKAGKSAAGAAAANIAAPIRNLAAVKGRRFLAFAGIGNPRKFYASLENAGGIIAARRDFADHHFFSAAEIDNIAAAARAGGLVPATTAKDYIRLQSEGLAGRLGEALALDVRPRFAAPDFCGRILAACRQNYQRRI